MNKTIIKAINISHKKGVQKRPVHQATMIANHGIQGDAHAGDWHRQVSLLSNNAIEDIQKRLPHRLADGDFAENLVVDGGCLDQLGIGSRLKIGASAILEITQIGKECHHHCAIYRLAGDCIMPRLGLFARVLEGGSITKGDELAILVAQPREEESMVNA